MSESFVHFYMETFKCNLLVPFSLSRGQHCWGTKVSDLLAQVFCYGALSSLVSCDVIKNPYQESYEVSIDLL